VIEATSLEEENGHPVMCLEDFGGTSLAQLLRTGQWHRGHFRNTAIGILEILCGIHDLGVIHKDLNPSNILINPYTEELRIIDFGIATESDGETSEHQEPGISGTLAYLAPEQTGRSHRTLDRRTDFYSLGVTFFELVTGELPFHSEEPMDLVHLHITREPAKPRERDEHIPEALSDLISSMLAKNPEDRPADAETLLGSLRALPPMFQDEDDVVPYRGVATRLGSLSLTTAPTTHGPHKLWGDMLDYTSLLKSSRAISSEIVLEDLIERLVTVLLENAGAQRGVLLLEKEGSFFIEADGSDQEVTLTNAITLEDPRAAEIIPLSLVCSVIDQKQNLILEGPESYGVYGEDPYFRDHGPVSILCTPILGQGKTLGLIYLENYLVRGMFLQERSEVVRVLAAQAAIAIENATLMAHLRQSRAELATANATLEQKVAERTEALQKINEAQEVQIAESKRTQKTLMELARFGPKSFTSRLRQLLETCSETLEVERVSYWTLNQDQETAKREDLFVRSTDTHFEELRELNEVVFPGFMDDFRKMEYLAVDDVATAERTRHIAETYFAPKGISSLLVVSVWHDGAIVGGLSLGHVGPPRPWTPIRVDFATAIGQMISLALEADERHRVEQRLRMESEIPRLDPNPILRFDLEGVITYANPAARELLHDPEGCPLSEVLPEFEDVDITACVRDGKAIRRGGTIGSKYFQFELRGTPELAIGQVFGFDVTELHTAKEALHQSGQELEAIFEATNDGILIIGDHRLHTGNRRLLEMFGFTDRSELDHVHLSELWPRYQPDGGDSLMLWKQKTAEVTVSGQCRFDWRFQKRDGQTFSADVQLSLLSLATREMILVTIHDISHRLEMEEELRLSEERRRYAVEGSRDGIWDWQIDKNRVFFSPRWKEILGYGEDEISDRWAEWEKRVHPDDIERVDEAIQQVLTRQTDAVNERYRMLAGDGSVRWILTRARAVFNDRGEPVRLSGSNTDITEHNLAEERFRVLFEFSSDPHLLYDNEGIYDCNPATLRMFGAQDKHQVIGKHPDELSPEHQPDGRDSREKAGEMSAIARMQGHHRFEWLIRRFDGSELITEVTLTRVIVSERASMLLVIQDITERKRHEALEGVQTHILEMISSNCALKEILQTLVEDTGAQMDNRRCGLLALEDFSKDPYLITLDWSLALSPDAVIDPFEDTDHLEADLSALLGGTDTADLKAYPIHDDDAMIRGVFFTIGEEAETAQRSEIATMAARLAELAITHERRARSLQEARERAELANQSKVRFLSEMSHELRTPLNAILGFSQLLRKEDGLSDRVREHTDMIITNGEELLELINDILEMASEASTPLILEEDSLRGRDRAEELVPEDTVMPSVDHLPEELVAEIERASVLGDLGQLIELVTSVRAHDEVIADMMVDFLDRFAYDALLRLFRGAGHDA